MTHRREDPNPVTLEERYAEAASTSDLGLPHGDGAGAQGILAAAAWTEVHLGSALLRLRSQWDSIRPTRKHARPYELLRTSGLTRDQARVAHLRERAQNGFTYAAEKEAARGRLREYAQVRMQLTVHAVRLGIEEPDTTARTVLDHWLDDQNAEVYRPDERSLRAYLDDCLNMARAGLRQGVRGRTNNHPG